MRKTRVKTALYHYIPVALVGLAVVLWFHFVPSKQTINSAAPAEQAQKPHKTENLPLSALKTTVMTVDKDAIEKAIPGALSAETRANPNRFAFPPAELTPWQGKRVVTPVLDNVTGEVHVEDKRLPPKFFEWKKELILDGRYLFFGDHVAEVDVRVIPVRINARDGGTVIDPYVFGGIDVRREDSRFGSRAGIGVQVKF